MLSWICRAQPSCCSSVRICSAPSRSLIFPSSSAASAASSTSRSSCSWVKGSAGLSLPRTINPTQPPGSSSGAAIKDDAGGELSRPASSVFSWVAIASTSRTACVTMASVAQRRRVFPAGSRPCVARRPKRAGRWRRGAAKRVERPVEHQAQEIGAGGDARERAMDLAKSSRRRAYWRRDCEPVGASRESLLSCRMAVAGRTIVLSLVIVIGHEPHRGDRIALGHAADGAARDLDHVAGKDLGRCGDSSAVDERAVARAEIFDQAGPRRAE